MTCGDFVGAAASSTPPCRWWIALGLLMTAASVAVADDYPLGKYWNNRKLGSRDFYVAEHGNYHRDKPGEDDPFYQAGIFPGVVPGFWEIKWFDPARWDKLPPRQKEKVRYYLDNRIPFGTVNYTRMFGNPRPPKAAIEAAGDLWFGDGQNEEPIYRLEPVFHFAKTGEKWKGSSMYLWKDGPALEYLKNELKPALDRALPGWDRDDFVWTRSKMQILKETYVLTYLSANERPLCSTMYLAPQAIARARPDVPNVMAKAGDAREYAIQRGLARQFGGNRFLTCGRGHEPLERYLYQRDTWFNTPMRENHGLPWPHVVYYVFRPYLGGVNHYCNECFASSLIDDPEDNGTWRPSKVGKLVRRLLQFAEDHPDRGTLYTPVAFVMGYDRELSAGAYGGDRIPFDDADWTNYALVRDLLFPEHRDVRNTGSYSCLAPCGELIDVLKPDPRRPVDPDMFDGYKLVILGAGITWSDQYRAVIDGLRRKGVRVLTADPVEWMTPERHETIETRQCNRVKRPLLKPEVCERLRRAIADVAPFTLEVAPEVRDDFSWTVFKKGKNWRVVVYNYSLRRESLSVEEKATARAIARYPYPDVPFRLVPKVPVRDCAELFGCRDVRHETVDGKFVVTESMRAGELRMYEFSEDTVELDEVERPVNYARGCPVTATSVYQSFVPESAVDGRRDNDYFWQSAPGKRTFELPQTLTVDLREEREIDHFYLLMHVWPDLDQDIRRHVYRWTAEASADGKAWTTLVDESRNETAADADGIDFHFKPVRARYVRLNVLHNSGMSGANVVEIEVTGRDRRRFRPARRSLRKPWEVEIPADVAAGKATYLRKIKPNYVKPGWMPDGRTWESLNGWVRLYPSVSSPEGLACPNSLYGESPFEAEYAVPPGATHFVSVCGIGARSRVASVEFKAYVDGVERFSSGVVRCGMPLPLALVDVKGAKTLKLVVTDGGDTTIEDYSWWGDARFVEAGK